MVNFDIRISKTECLMNRNLQDKKYFINFFLLNNEQKIKSKMSRGEDKVFIKNQNEKVES